MAPSVTGSQKPDARDNSAVEQGVGQATSVIVPLIELGAVAFETWVVTYLICTQYLINPSNNLRQRFDIRPRRATGIAIIVIYAILLFITLISWMRLVQVIWSKQDLVPLGDHSTEKGVTSAPWVDQHDAYICDYLGKPLWCDKCHNWKPDRTHHCKELGRCVKKMDHYCPWAGGIIAESSHKFFQQFVTCGTLYTLYTWIVVAVFFSDRASKMNSRPGTWIAALALPVVFFIFASTMAYMTGYNLMINYTSVEGIQRGGIHNIAFLISHMPQDQSLPPTPPTPSRDEPDNLVSQEDDWPVLRIVKPGAGRVYVVMQSKPFEHPWYIGLMNGWKDTMGHSPVDWVLPIKMSPCKEKSHKGEFEWGEVVYDMARQYEKTNPGTRLAILA